ncbi:hypothetical protein NDU88_000690 [Pleurodeles waltl]|uniref:Uncharacterized protein n=1 Tax=Pleurodeles waltl TaxID=8319 RepID=A0AAV7SXR2_PLEWA|nr:hypothetical protein NDU88_000690 [Pleurodeles waltl]
MRPRRGQCHQLEADLHHLEGEFGVAPSDADSDFTSISLITQKAIHTIENTNGLARSRITPRAKPISRAAGCVGFSCALELERRVERLRRCRRT